MGYGRKAISIGDNAASGPLFTKEKPSHAGQKENARGTGPRAS
jgi:hypothetical protein